MKSKFIFIIVFIALFFNIGHDLFIVNLKPVCESNTVVKVSMAEVDGDECCDNINELHENFHFSAIIHVVNLEFYNPIQNALAFIDAIPPSISYQSSFRPPIA